MINSRLEVGPGSSSAAPTRTAPEGSWKAWLVLALLAALLYAGTLKELVRDWWNDPDYSYCFLVPVVAGYVAWRDRFRYKRIAWAPSGFGLAIIALALAILIAGTLGADLFIPRISLCILLAGMTGYLCGWAMLRALAFPLGYLALMVPLPSIMHNQITFPLQIGGIPHCRKPDQLCWDTRFPGGKPAACAPL